MSLASPALAGGFFSTRTTWKPIFSCCYRFSIAKSCPTLQPNGQQHTRLLCPLSPRVCSHSRLLNQRCCTTFGLTYSFWAFLSRGFAKFPSDILRRAHASPQEENPTSLSSFHTRVGKRKPQYKCF